MPTNYPDPSKKYWITREDRKLFPLIGENICDALDQIFEVVENKQGGRVFYIRGQGGTGKSEAIDVIKHKLTTESSYVSKQILFGGVIDMYSYDSFSPLTLFRTISENIKAYWNEQYAKVRKNFEGGTVQRRSLEAANDSVNTAFSDFEAKLNSLTRLGFAFPGFQGIEQLINRRRNAVLKAFKDGFEALAQDFCIVMCFDTAELLRNDDPMDLREHMEAVEWLRDFISSSSSKNAVFIIAGRPSVILTSVTSVQETEQLAIPLKRPRILPSSDETRPKFSTQSQEFGEFLRATCAAGGRAENYQLFDFHPLTVAEIQEYCKCYAIYITRNSSPAKAELDDKEAAIVQNLTMLGKPLFVDWFCNLYFEAGQFQDLSRLDANLNFAREEFINTLSQKIKGAELSQNEQWARVFIIEARKGLDLETLYYLFNEIMPEAVTKEEASEIFKSLKGDTFTKVRSLLTQEAGEERELIYLHDEIHKSLYFLIRQSQLQEVQAITRQVCSKLAQAYGKSEQLAYRDITLHNPLAIRALEKKRRQYTGIKLQPGLNTPGNLYTPESEVFWFENKEVLTRYIGLNNLIQNRLLERMYYRLAETAADDTFGQLNDGYDDYCYLALMALREHLYGFDLRLKKEYLRFERDYFTTRWLKSKQNKPDEQNQDEFSPHFLDTSELDLLTPTELRKKVLAETGQEELEPNHFNELRMLEGDLRTIKRLLRDLDPDEQASEIQFEGGLYNLKDTKSRSEDSLERLLVKYAERCIRQSEKFADSKYAERARLCAADALVSMYDYIDLYQASSFSLTSSPRQDTRTILGEAIALLKSIPIEVEITEYHQPRNYNYWFCNFLSGKAHYNLGLVERNTHFLEKGIAEFRKALHYFNNAQSRSIEINLNDTLASLAYTYHLNGQDRLAEEACELVVKAQMTFGNIGYVAQINNILAQVLLDSNRHLLSSYKVATKALQLVQDVCDRELNETNDVIELGIYRQIRATLGKVSRRMARHYYQSDASNARLLFKQAEEHFEEVLKYISGSRSSFKHDILNELGCTYRAWGNCIKNIDKEPSLAETYFDKAFAKLNESLEICGNDERFRLDRVDTLHDIAGLLGYQAKFKEGRKYLAEAAELIQNYQLSQTVGERESRRPEFSLAWAKIYMQKAQWEFDAFDSEKPVTDFPNGGHLENGTVYILWALSYILQFEPALLQPNLVYIRDTGIIEGIEQILLNNFSLLRNRLWLLGFIKVMFPALPNLEISGDLALVREKQTDNEIILTKEQIPYLKGGLRFMSAILNLGIVAP